MAIDIEELLGRELHEVAEGVHVPALPALPQEAPRGARHWAPLLVAAAVVLIVAGAVALALSVRGDDAPQPAPPSPTVTDAPTDGPTDTATDDTVARTAPTVPYVLDRELYVDGTQVPGTWWSVEFGDAGWLALRDDYTWWWGTGPQAVRIEGLADSVPVISPNGQYVAGIDDQGRVTGFETRAGGEGFGAVPVDLGDPQSGDPVRVRAVTDDGRVIVQGAGTAVMWLPLVDQSVVDLTGSLDGQTVESNTPAGLVVMDGELGPSYLAEIADDGELTELPGTVPLHDSLVVSPGAAWLVWTDPGTLGGEVTALPTLNARTLDTTAETLFAAPKGWAFRVRAWTWEDDEHLVAPVVRNDVGAGPERMVRCGVPSGRCVLTE